MATITKGKIFTNGELVTPATIHQLVDAATISGIVNADIAASAAIADSKLAQITTAGKVLPAAVAGTAVITTDSRLSDARTPVSHTHDDRYYTETEIDTKLSGLPVSGHTHTIANVTGLQTALDGKQASGSYAPATGIAPSAITGTAVVTADARLSDARTPTAHTHGNITNTGAIGTTASLPVITGTSGVLQAGSFGSTSGSFCQGNDLRLSDQRLPSDGSVTDAKVSSTAAIADTKLATISTAGKVANSATTATSANTPNTIITRDASGNFQTNSITALSATSSFGAVKIGRGSGTDITNTSLGGGNPLSSITTGANNTCVGFDSQNKTNSGTRNVSVGQESLYNNTSGSKNVAIGTVACNQNLTGNQNVAVGDSALYNNVLSSGNTAIGDASLNYHTTGNNNTAIGNLAGSFINNYSNSTCVGYNSAVTASNQIRLGDSSVTAVVSQVGNWSDARDKTDIRNTILGLEFIEKLRPVDFKWDCREDYRTPPPLQNATEEEKTAYLESVKLGNITHNGTHKRTRYHHGLIAQEIKSIIEQTGTDFGGFQDHTITGGDAAMTISYIELIGPLIKAVQELAARVAVLEAR